jgi:serine/threonine protein kinase
MGEVYEASDARLGRHVAIKVLPETFAADPERRARFEQEARAAAALNHPNIAAIYDVGGEGATHFIVQELVAGASLRDALTSRRDRPLAEWLGVAAMSPARWPRTPRGSSMRHQAREHHDHRRRARQRSTSAWQTRRSPGATPTRTPDHAGHVAER